MVKNNYKPKEAKKNKVSNLNLSTILNNVNQSKIVKYLKKMEK